MKEFIILIKVLEGSVMKGICWDEFLFFNGRRVGIFIKMFRIVFGLILFWSFKCFYVGLLKY